MSVVPLAIIEFGQRMPNEFDTAFLIFFNCKVNDGISYFETRGSLLRVREQCLRFNNFGSRKKVIFKCKVLIGCSYYLAFSLI